MLRSFAAGLGDVAGFSVVLVVISALREMLGSGMLYGRLLPNFAQFRFNFIMLAPGAFLLVGLLLAIVQGIRLHAERHNNSGEAQ
jgi:electron transport complex protein RnfE